MKQTNSVKISSTKFTNEDKYHLNILNRQGLIKYNHGTSIHSYSGIGYVPVDTGIKSISLTENGKHFFERYNEYLKNKILSVFLSRIILPIIVSFITTLVTLFIKSKF